MTACKHNIVFRDVLSTCWTSRESLRLGFSCVRAAHIPSWHRACFHPAFNLFGRNSCLWTMLWKESRYALGIDISIFGVKNNGQKYSPNKPDSTSNWHFYNRFVGLSDRFAINQFGNRQVIILRAQVSHLWKTAITLSLHLHVSWLQHSDSKCELVCTSKTDSPAPLRVVDT